MLCEPADGPSGRLYPPPESSGPRRLGRAVFIPCPDCGGQAIAHCCEGLCEQPDRMRRVRHCRAGNPSKWPRRCSQASSISAGKPASAQIAKNQTQPVAAAMKPAPDDR